VVTPITEAIAAEPMPLPEDEKLAADGIVETFPTEEDPDPPVMTEPLAPPARPPKTYIKPDFGMRDPTYRGLSTFSPPPQLGDPKPPSADAAPPRPAPAQQRASTDPSYHDTDFPGRPVGRFPRPPVKAPATDPRSPSFSGVRAPRSASSAQAAAAPAPTIARQRYVPPQPISPDDIPF
jgi:hypothetical protein